jgi:phage-related baseplate assembly protein
MNTTFPNPAIPELLKTPGFERYLAVFTTGIVDHILITDPEMAAKAQVAFSDEAGFAAKMAEACAVVLINRIRNENEKALSMFAPFAKADMLDLVASNLGLKRLVTKRGDPNAFPQIPDENETDEQLLLRYYLQPYALKPGSRKGYEFHALTLDEKPLVEVDSSQTNQVVVSYTFPSDSVVSQISDARCRRTNPGEVTITILGRNGVADQTLLDQVSSYIGRDDIKEETDTVIISAATHADYQVHIKVKNTGFSNPQFIKSQLEAELPKFTDVYRKLEGTVRPEQVGGVVYAAKVFDFQVIQPAGPVICDHTQAPNCTGITVELI